MTDLHWDAYAACKNHPLLDPDAWFEFSRGHPSGQGLQARMVCLFQCPVREQCAAVEHGPEAIAGGGWTDRAGQFHNPGNGRLIDAHQAGAYLGISPDRFQGFAKRYGIEPVGTYHTRNLYPVEMVQYLARKVGPPHGSAAAMSLHQLRGEQPCDKCIKLRELVLAAA